MPRRGPLGAYTVFFQPQRTAFAQWTPCRHRRADVVALSASGDIWIIEVKSSVEDFRADQKWPEYRAFSDPLYFAVAPEFPVDILPADPGLILADRFGGEIVRPAPEARLTPARRKSMTLRFAHAAALALHTAIDSSHENS